MFVFEPTNAKLPTPVTGFGNCQIFRLAFMPLGPMILVFLGNSGPISSSGTTECQQRSFSTISQFRVLELPQAGTFAGVTTGITAMLHVLRTQRISGGVEVQNMIGNHGVISYEVLALQTLQFAQNRTPLVHMQSQPCLNSDTSDPEPHFWGLYPSASGARFRRSPKMTPNLSYVALSPHLFTSQVIKTSLLSIWARLGREIAVNFDPCVNLSLLSLFISSMRLSSSIERV
ncbi:hypothetical protein B0H10DRAFT_1950081 [Mycena sp. CBHHK59/15]|nr:hypothetical protein B0H10DRAFT_1950077 [Mycena sp. CBHHK59/15]KAJ6615242.1 hypothetical protein B0H10DRAFT_1950081 [Mycena sp. CBHHK59/15]